MLKKIKYDIIRVYKNYMGGYKIRFMEGVMEDRTFELLEKIYSEFLDFKEDMSEFKEDTTNRLEHLEQIQNNMQIMQEKMSKDIKTITEVQANHMEQNERQHREMMKVLDEKSSLLEGAIRHLAGETIMHTAELSVLKKRLG